MTSHYGVGARVVRRLGREGFRSTLISRGGALEQLVGELRAEVLEIEAVAADIEDLGGYRTTLERIFQGPGGPGVVVYNAASPDPGEILDTTVGRLRRAYDVDVIGAVVAGQVAASVLRTPGAGTLLFTSGGFADHPVPALASLSMGKAALRSSGDSDRRRCPGGRHPCRNHHDRGLGRAWDSVLSGQDRRALWTAHTDPTDAWQTEYRYTGA